MTNSGNPDSGNRDSGSPEPVLAPQILAAAADWVLLAPETSDDTALQDRFTAWLAQAEAHALAYAQMSALWADPALADPALAAALAPQQRAVVVPLAPRRRGLRWAALALAASLAAALALPFADDLWIGWRSDYRTATGIRRSVTLPDGSRVELNTNSALALAFEGPRREVALLRGEARFEVESDPLRPFIVQAGHAEVIATGTAFTVRREAEADQVVLLEGVVTVTGPTGAPPMILSPGEGLRVSQTASVLSQGQREPAWRNGRIVFDAMALAEVADEVDRYLGGYTLVLTGGSREVSGSLLLDQLETGLGTLTAATGLRLQRLPGGVRVIW